MSVVCIDCDSAVTARMHAVSCDICEGWQHRRCGTGISYDDYRLAMKGKKDLHFVCARCFAPDNGEEDADDILGAPTLTREDNVSEAEDMEEMEEPPVLELSVPMSENMASFHDNFSEDEEMEEPPVLELSVPIAESTVRSHVEEDDSADDSAEPMEEDSSFSQEPASIRIDYTITEPDVITERSIQDPTPSEETAEVEHELTYEVIPAGTQKGKDLLVDSLGYSYNVKDVRGITRRWLCSVRNRKVKCKASIIERNGYFRSNSSDHIHPPDPARELTAKVTSKAKDIAANDVFKSAKSIVSDAKEGLTSLTCVETINEDYVARRTNRKRENMRPDEPKDMDFELEHSAIPEDFYKFKLEHSAIPEDFYRREVAVDGRRHLIFFTDKQLELLKTTSRWYIDGTFKVMRLPFVMLLSIHAFVRRGDCSKQVPLAFVMMSGRRTRDYLKVLKAIGNLMEGECSVEGFVVDYEKALWRAIQQVFIGATINGCVFHWGQAVWRHVQVQGWRFNNYWASETYLDILQTNSEERR